VTFIKKSSRISPKISLVLLDWSVRESFHLLHYLSAQTLARHQFEVVIVEYYSSLSKAIKKFSDQVDTWLLLEMPEDCYYHKHLMYNVGITVAKGEIIIICDSDAMAKPSFLQSVLSAFEADPEIILHIDQFRNNRKDLYPFCFPSFEEVTGRGCINNSDGKTTGVMPTNDPIHERNYGACLCAKRVDLISIGGADEHIDFVGHICGPYDLSFRLINLGKREVWHQHEFLYHTWHPGQAGVDNYLGPHDGRHISTTSLEALHSRRIFPNVMNAAILSLANDRNTLSECELEKILISPENFFITKSAFLTSTKSRAWAEKTYAYVTYGGYQIVKKADLYHATPLLNILNNKPYVFSASDIGSIKHKIRGRVLYSCFYLGRNVFLFLPYCLKNLLGIFLRNIASLSRKQVAAIAMTRQPKKNIEFYFFLRKFLKKLSNIFISTKLTINRYLGLLSNLTYSDQPENKKIIFLINNSIGYCFFMHLIISFLRKNFITIININEPDSLHICLNQYRASAGSRLVAIVSKTCFMQYSSIFMQACTEEQKFCTIVI